MKNKISVSCCFLLMLAGCRWSTDNPPQPDHSPPKPPPAADLTADSPVSITDSAAGTKTNANTAAADPAADTNVANPNTAGTDTDIAKSNTVKSNTVKNNTAQSNTAQSNTAKINTANTNTSENANAMALLEEMAAAYKTAVSYSDRAAVTLIGKRTVPDAAAVKKCRVVFRKPQEWRLEIHDGLFVCSKKTARAAVRDLPNQIVSFPPPEQWTFDVLFRDRRLDAAMDIGIPRTVLRFPPQLILLLANNPLHTFCPKDAEITRLPPQQTGDHLCDVVQIAHPGGNRTLWIDRTSRILRRFDYHPVGMPVPDGFESIDVIRAEFTDARFNEHLPEETFQMKLPENTEYVAAFRPVQDTAVQDTSAQNTAIQNTAIQNTVIQETVIQETMAQETAAQEAYLGQLKAMVSRDCYRLSPPMTIPADAPATPEPASPPLPPAPMPSVWSLPLAGAGSAAVLSNTLSGTPPKLLIACEGNSLAVADLQGKLLQKFKPEGMRNDDIIAVVSTCPAGSDRAAWPEPSSKPSPEHTAKPEQSIKQYRKQYIGILTLNGSALYIYQDSPEAPFNESSKPVLVYKPAAEDRRKRNIADFLFYPYPYSPPYPHHENVFLLVGLEWTGEETAETKTAGDETVPSEPATSEPTKSEPAKSEPSGQILILDLAGKEQMQWKTAGVPDQMEWAFREEQRFLLTTGHTPARGTVVMWETMRNIRQDTVRETGDANSANSASFKPFTPLKPFKTFAAAAGWQVQWFGAEGGTVAALLINSATAEVRFAGWDSEGKERWSHLLPAGKYEESPIYLPDKKHWLILSAAGQITVFDTDGNKIDFVAANKDLTALCVFHNGKQTLLLLSDGKSVAACRTGKNLP